LKFFIGNKDSGVIDTKICIAEDTIDNSTFKPRDENDSGNEELEIVEAGETHQQVTDSPQVECEVAAVEITTKSSDPEPNVEAVEVDDNVRKKSKNDIRVLRLRNRPVRKLVPESDPIEVLADESLITTTHTPTTVQTPGSDIDSSNSSPPPSEIESFQSDSDKDVIMLETTGSEAGEVESLVNVSLYSSPAKKPRERAPKSNLIEVVDEEGISSEEEISSEEGDGERNLLNTPSKDSKEDKQDPQIPILNQRIKIPSPDAPLLVENVSRSLYDNVKERSKSKEAIPASPGRVTRRQTLLQQSTPILADVEKEPVSSDVNSKTLRNSKKVLQKSESPGRVTRRQTMSNLAVEKKIESIDKSDKEVTKGRARKTQEVVDNLSSPGRITRRQAALDPTILKVDDNDNAVTSPEISVSKNKNKTPSKINKDVQTMESSPARVTRRQTLAGKLPSTKAPVSDDTGNETVFEKAKDERNTVSQSPSRVTRRQTMILGGTIGEDNNKSTDVVNDLRKTPTRKDIEVISNVPSTERVTRRKTMHSQLPKDIEKEDKEVERGDVPGVDAEVKKKKTTNKITKDVQQPSPGRVTRRQTMNAAPQISPSDDRIEANNAHISSRDAKQDPSPSRVSHTQRNGESINSKDTPQMRALRMKTSERKKIDKNK
jgi:hypothetical protein